MANTINAVFLDRDGVLNKYPGDYKYVTSLEEFKLLPRVEEALSVLKEKGYYLFIASNQAGVSKGIYSQDTLNLITQNLLDNLNKHKIAIESVLYCTHREEENCNCRKPKVGLIHNAIEHLKRKGLVLDIKRSFFIGDSIRDIETGKSAGLKTILVFSGKEKPNNSASWKIQPDFTAQDIFEAALIIKTYTK